MSQLKAQKVIYAYFFSCYRDANISDFNLQEKLTEELRESLKKSRKESELNTVESQIRGLETRLKYNKSDLSATVSVIHYIVYEKYIYLKICQ